MNQLPASLMIATRERSWEGELAGWLPNPAPILKVLERDIRTYREMRADAHMGGCIRRRKSAVLAMSGTLEREGCTARIHKSIEGILADLAATADPTELGAHLGLRALRALRAEALDGALYGYQPIEIGWGRVGSLLVPGARPRQAAGVVPLRWRQSVALSRARRRDGWRVAAAAQVSASTPGPPMDFPICAWSIDPTPSGEWRASGWRGWSAMARISWWASCRAVPHLRNLRPWR